MLIHATETTTITLDMEPRDVIKTGVRHVMAAEDQTPITAAAHVIDALMGAQAETGFLDRAQFFAAIAEFSAGLAAFNNEQHDAFMENFDPDAPF